MGTFDLKLGISLGLLCHVSDAETADVIVTACRNKDCVEVTKADGTVVLEHFTFNRVMCGISVPNMDVFLVNVSLNADLVALSNFSILYGLVNTTPFFSIIIFLVIRTTVVVAHAAIPVLLDGVQVTYVSLRRAELSSLVPRAGFDQEISL